MSASAASSKPVLVFPCAGLGTRLKVDHPKALQAISARHTVLSRLVRQLTHLFPDSPLVVVCSEYPGNFRRLLPANSEVVLNTLPQKTNVGYSTGLGLARHSGRAAVIVLGDLVCEGRVLAPLASFTGEASLALTAAMPAREVGVHLVQNRIGRFGYALPLRWGQILCLTSQDATLLSRLALEKKRQRWFLHEVVNDLLDLGLQLFPVHGQGLCTDLDRPEDMGLIRAIVQKKLLVGSS